MKGGGNMSELLVMFVVAVMIPALLIISVAIRDIVLGEHPHRRVDDF